MKTIFKIGLLSVSIFSMMSCQQKANLSLPAIFSDNMVMQQNSNAAIWGKASPGTEIKVSGDWGESATATAEADSSWQVQLPTLEAGGPHSLSFSTSDTSLTVKNILFGEVWLASGQSNMEMPVKGWPPNDTIMNSAQTIANSANPAIRMFTVARNISSTQLKDVSGAWASASPETTGNFSATAYFFARKLHNELNVPVGIIHSSWGGTPIEAWISKKELTNNTDFSAIIKDLEDFAPQAEVYNKWLTANESINILPTPENKEPFKNLDAFDDYCSNPKTNTEDWPSIKLPTTIEQTEIGAIDGIVWFRKEVQIPEKWSGKDLIISLGPIDDMDVTYFNGERIGGTEVEGFYQKVRYYTVPADMVKPGTATIAVKVIDNQGGGGIYGTPDQMILHPKANEADKIELSGEWAYNVVGQITGSKLYLFNPEANVYDSRPELSIHLSSHTPTVLYNAMIAPLLPYTLKGAIWYQGETNVGRANQYMDLKASLINNWRKVFDNTKLPFYYVQLAPWNYDNVDGISSANLREAQRRSLRIPNTGMAVTLDIGNVDNIHPANKTDVGERLALWALSQNYSMDIPYSGPMPENFSKEDRKIVISFDNAYEGLELKTNVPNQFEIAGEDGKFYPAIVEVNDNKLHVSSPLVNQPQNVRYAYKNGAEAALFNGVGLPAPSFTSEEEIPE